MYILRLGLQFRSCGIKFLLKWEKFTLSNYKYQGLGLSNNIRLVGDRPQILLEL